MRFATLVFAFLLAAPAAFAQLPPSFFAAPPSPTVYVTVHTSLGDIVLELDRAHAPRTVANFVRYVQDKHYDNTKFYRIVPGFVIQAGSLGVDGFGHMDRDAIPLEANNGLKNVRGAISMARASDPNSAQAEYFIVLSDNPGLDPDPADTENKTGYAVFGHVITGLDVVDKIAAVQLGGMGPFGPAAPLEPVIVTSMEVISRPPMP